MFYIKNNKISTLIYSLFIPYYCSEMYLQIIKITSDDYIKNNNIITKNITSNQFNN